ncbi:MAG: ABC transporter permease [Clostridia bacterium]|nr:ABC transporter permease [Clostridia bacterium]
MQKKYVEVTDNNKKFRRSVNTLLSMVNRNVRNQYRNSVLGILWTVLNPLLNMIVIALVFSMLFNRNQMDGIYYPVYILSGNIVFGLLRNATINSLPCIVNNYDLLSKTRIVHEIFPLSNVLSATVNFFFSMIALFIVMVIFINKPGVGFHPTILMTVAPLLPAFLLFCLGVSFILSTIYIRFRDIKHIYDIVLTLWMYLTPLFYSLELIKGHKTATYILKLNPMFHYVTYFRSLLTGTVPSLFSHAMIYAWGAGMFLVGFLIFHFSKKKFLLYI